MRDVASGEEMITARDEVDLVRPPGQLRLGDGLEFEPLWVKAKANAQGKKRPTG